jgi:hypothetical protein
LTIHTSRDYNQVDVPIIILDNVLNTMDITTALTLTLIGIIIGFLIGMLISNLRTGHDKKLQVVPVAETDNIDRSTLTNQSVESSNATPPRPTEPEGLIRIWYEAGKNQLVVETNNQIFSSAEDLCIEELRQLVNTTKDLNNWLGIHPQPDSTPRVNYVNFPVLEQPVARPVVQASTTQSPSNILEEIQQARKNPIKALLRAFEETNVAKIEPVTLTMAGQIDEILQKKLENTPYENSSIRLVDTPSQGVVVKVGLNQYDGVESVPDETIRNLIRDAVAEWEKLMLGK